MNPILKNILRNILAVMVGFVVCFLVNGLAIRLGTFISVPIPEGVDPNDIESIKANIDKYDIVHMLWPFLAHALGTLAGALVAAKIAASHHKLFAMVIAGLHFLGGLAMMYMLDFKPLWFSALDLGLAYFPMAFLGLKLAGKLTALDEDILVDEKL